MNNNIIIINVLFISTNKNIITQSLNEYLLDSFYKNTNRKNIMFDFSAPIDPELTLVKQKLNVFFNEPRLQAYYTYVIFDFYDFNSEGKRINFKGINQVLKNDGILFIVKTKKDKKGLNDADFDTSNWGDAMNMYFYHVNTTNYYKKIQQINVLLLWHLIGNTTTVTDYLLEQYKFNNKINFNYTIDDAKIVIEDNIPQQLQKAYYNFIILNTASFNNIDAYIKKIKWKEIYDLLSPSGILICYDSSLDYNNSKMSSENVEDFIFNENMLEYFDFHEEKNNDNNYYTKKKNPGEKKHSDAEVPPPSTKTNIAKKDINNSREENNMLNVLIIWEHVNIISVQTFFNMEANIIQHNNIYVIMKNSDFSKDFFKNINDESLVTIIINVYSKYQLLENINWELLWQKLQKDGTIVFVNSEKNQLVNNTKIFYNFPIKNSDKYFDIEKFDNINLLYRKKENISPQQKNSINNNTHINQPKTIINNQTQTNVGSKISESKNNHSIQKSENINDRRKENISPQQKKSINNNTHINAQISKNNNNHAIQRSEKINIAKQPNPIINNQTQTNVGLQGHTKISESKNNHSIQKNENIKFEIMTLIIELFDSLKEIDKRYQNNHNNKTRKNNVVSFANNNIFF